MVRGPEPAQAPTNEQHQSQSLHHPARDRRHLRRLHLHALDRDRGRHEHPGARRQRLRRGGGDGVHAAGGRAASQRARRRRAGHRARHAQGQRQDRGDLRAGAGADGRDHRALQEPRPRSRARHRAARLLRARHVRDLDAAAARLRHHAARRRAQARDLLRRRRPAAGRARELHHRHGRAAVPRALADLGGGLSARRQGAGARHAVRQQAARRNLFAHPARGRERRRQSRQADRARPQDVVARLRRRGDRPLLPHPGADGFERRAPPRRAHRRRHGALCSRASKRR